MYYELYIDVFFLVNFMMDAILLEILRKILGCPVSHGRVLLGAGAGAFGTCVVLCLPVPYGFVRIVASHGLINLIMLKTGFGIRWGREMAKAFLLLYISGFLMGGILSVFRPYLRTAGLFFAFAVISYYGALGVWKLLGALAGREKTRREVLLFRGGKSCRVRAIVDTGNTLRDSVTGKPVCVIDQKTADALGLFEKPEGLRFLPYHSVGRREGVLPAFPLDKMELPGNPVRVVERPLVAVCQEISRDDHQMLLNPDVL